ncbi:thioredoxin reductase [Candidatus Uzinura diaspidicola str. ASNER]|uniref:Thioredoxin reductase n=1 Tax=Candidatus Uzinura diaspidicola str. ASNER TaxID=1133592 RepID=L7VG81_9FLAO|nr:thioredoxin reductase [Candidatus Uzinura diaspidicola str. ASNER]
MSKIIIYNCVIIGSGPGGYAAAIYAGRADLKPILYTGDYSGGQLTTSTEVENYPGYTKGITGFQLMVNFKKQAERFNTIIKEQRIIKVDLLKEIGSIHSLLTETGEKVNTKGIIIATGSTAKYLGLESEKRFRGSGVSTCATCDGFFYRGKVVAVVGGGDTAIEESIYLSKICKKVHLIVRRGTLRASKIIAHRANKILNLEIHFFHEVKEVLGKKDVEGILILNKETSKERILSIEGLFIAIGHKPNTSIFKNQIQLDENGYILTINRGTHTNYPGVFVAGDVKDYTYRQAITAAASGCMAALDLDKYISTLNFNG